MTSEEPVAFIQGVYKSYQMDAVEVAVLKDIEVLIRPGLFTVLLGPSGSGKTTLLNLIGCIDRADRGEVTVAGKRIATMNDDELSDFRAANIGFVFQNFNLIPVLTARENIEYPLVLAGMEEGRRKRRVEKVLRAVELHEHGDHRPGQLSGGQRQRVAIARALAVRPKLVVADEPTANLDSTTGTQILKLMRSMQMRYKISFLFSSHDSNLIKEADDLIVLRDGVIQSIRRKAPEIEAAHSQPAEAAPDDLDDDEVE